MRSIINPVEQLTVEELLRNDKYVIPLYQRNYAWTDVEITQLLQDVYDKLQDDIGSNYYLGTLVIDNRDDGKFELIDGQQRHTTITLIHSVLIGEYHYPISILKSNLEFDAREEIQKYIEKLFSSYKASKDLVTENKGLINIKNAIRIIENFFQDVKEVEKEKFGTYFYNNVKMIRISVPPKTDINHYFEVMNNRGEQLEKHEILKARFVKKIDESLKERFADIWNACSQMDNHIQRCFKKEIRNEIFGQFFTDIPNNFLVKRDDVSHNENNTFSDENDFILNILNNQNIDRSTDLNETKNSDKYKSIIDFPNFLLQVLAIYRGGVSLDDKKLLTAFGDSDDLPDPIAFGNALLYYRILFDKYIIKRAEENNDWSWSLLKPAVTNENIYYKNTFGGSDDEDLKDSEDSVANNEFIMVQSMLHMSFPGNSYKNWLFKALSFCSEKKGSINHYEFKKCLLDISKEYFESNKVFGFNNGIHTKRFLFNYLDYLLWAKYDINWIDEKYRDRFKKFKFSQSNSIEHMHPQKDVDSLKILPEEENIVFKDQRKILDHFGNLCLISQSSNSKYNDYNYLAKKQQFGKKESFESLKQVVMFSYNNCDDWNTEQIKDHGTKMLSILEDHYQNV